VVPAGIYFLRETAVPTESAAGPGSIGRGSIGALISSSEWKRSFGSGRRRLSCTYRAEVASLPEGDKAVTEGSPEAGIGWK
jgi:hypothetical protein